MKTWSTRLVAVMLVGALAFGVVGTAAAQGPGGNRGQRGDNQAGRVLQAVLNAFSEATGLTWADVQADITEDTTLGEILTVNGLDPEAVAADVKAALTADIEAALADESISQAAADRLLENLDTAIDRVLNAQLPRGMGQQSPRDRVSGQIKDAVDTTLLGVLAEMVDSTVADVVRDAVTPPTMAEVATELGLDPDAVIDEAVTRITERVNQMVADGTVTEDRAAEMLDGLRESLETRMDSPIGSLRGMRSQRDQRPGRGWLGT